MAGFFRNNPMALRHCLLYEYLQKNPIEKSFLALRKTFGPNVIKKKKFHFWFNQFKKGVFDINEDKKPITDMRDVLQSDKHALLVCILYESLKYKLAERVYKILLPKSNFTVYEIDSNPSFAMYKMFCKVIKEDVMEYQEFDFWFYRFLNKDYDLNYERNEDEKIYELVDMPIDVMEHIVEYLDIFDRINLAKTSRSLQTFVEEQKLFHHTLNITVEDDITTISFAESVKKRLSKRKSLAHYNIQYKENGVGCEKSFKKRETRFRGVHHWKQAFLDLKGILKNPKFHLDTLVIDWSMDGFYYKYFESLENVFNDLEDALKFTHRLNVKALSLGKYSNILLAKILPSMKPGYLTTIHLFWYDLYGDSLKKVFEMEQWKQAKYFRMYDFFMWPLRHLYHFKEFTVRLEELPVEDILQMKEILFTSTNFKKCSITVSTGVNAIAKEFGDYILQGQDESKYGKIYHYPVPNSTEYFEINTFYSYIKITRKKRL